MNARRTARSHIETHSHRFAIPLAIGLAAVAVLFRWLLDGWLGNDVPFVTVFGAVAVAVSLLGRGAAIVATVVGYVACSYLFVEPRGALALSDSASIAALAAFLVSCGVLIALGDATRSAHRRAQERSELLRTTLASVGDAVVTTDVEGRVTSMNRIAESLMALTSAETEGRPLDDVFQIVNEDTRERVESPASRCLREGAIVGLANHSVLIARDGTERPIDDSAAPILDQDGSVVGCVLVFRDVTDRRRSELAVQTSERELSDFFENATMALHFLAADGTILRANRAELEMLGYSREEFVGRHIAEFHTDRAAINEALSKLAAGETLARFPARMICKNGSIREVLLNANGLWEHGTLVHIRCFVLDVTEQKKAEVTRALLAAIVAASDDAIVSKTLEGTILSWNAGAERLFGYTAAEAIGHSIDLIIPPELRPQEREILERLGRGERLDHFETVRIAKDGRRLDISLTVSPIRDESGRVIGASKVGRDITARKQAELALHEADRRKDEFLATLAHELRNPLAPIRHSLEILKRSRGNPALLNQAVDTIGRQLSHLVQLVDDLLDVSRITRDKLRLRKTRVELASVINQAVEMCRPHADHELQTIDVSLPKEPVYLDGDPVRLTQVFTNLVNNACQYTQRGGRIWLTATTGDSDVTVSVKDSGIGMPADQLDGIFEMFAQVDDGQDRPRRGLGIGLTLVKRLVELHGGRVTAHSEGVGRGSEFEVRLPVLAVSTAPVESKPVEVPMLPPRRILVVDDNQDGAESIATLLQLNGHRTFVVHDGLAAVDTADRLRPDVILLDVGLPKISGIEVCRRIRSHVWGKNMVVIALTGWGQDSDRRTTSEAGFDGHLVKPVDYRDLERLLVELLPDSGAASSSHTV